MAKNEVKRIGWVGKSVPFEEVAQRTPYDDTAFSFAYYADEGKKSDWHKDDWPPYKVEIIIRRVE